MRRSQLSIFFIIGLLSVLIISFIYYSVNIKDLENDKSLVIDNEAARIKQYVEKCMYDIGFDGMFNHLAPQGGFITPAKESSAYMSYMVAYWNDGLRDISPDIDDAKEELAGYIEEKLPACFMDYPIDLIEIEILEPEVFVNFNYEDTELRLVWPMTIFYGESEKELSSFSARLPYNFAKDFGIAKKLIEDIIASQPRYYDIYNNCSRYERNGKTTIHVVNHVAEVKNHVQIISVFDYEPIFSNNQKTLKMQFAIRNMTAMGYCDA